MAVIQGNAHKPSVGGAGGHQINDSLRFEDGSAAQLNRTPASAGNLKTWTFSCWFKRGNLGTTYPTIFSTNDIDAGQYTSIIFYNEALYLNASGYGANYTLITNQVLRDVSGWYHLVWSVDTTQATSTDRMKLYINGEQVTSFSTATYPSLNKDLDVNATTLHTIGYFADYGRYWDGYLSDIYLIDGQALDPTDFGETIDGYWRPIAYAGTYGTNGFHLDFNGNTNDASGNGNDWTANNISAHDYVPDSPTNNFATWNPLQPTGGGAGVMTLSEGNLKATGGSSVYRQVMGNMSVLNGKWYTETYISAAGYPSWGVGWTYGKRYEPFPSGRVEAHLGYYTGGNVYFSVFGASYANLQVPYSGLWSGARAPTTGDVIGCAADFDNGKFWWSINGEWVNVGAGAGDPSAGTNPSQTYTVATYADELKSPHYVNYNGSAILNVGQDSTFAGNTTAGGNVDDNGVGDFKYAPPSGYLALCTANLPTPTIVDGSEHFNTVLYVGDGAASKSITSVNFEPNFTWIKVRNNPNNHRLFDSVRGASSDLISNSTGAESITSTRLLSFDTDGFTVGSNAEVNGSGYNHVAWNWKAGGTAVSNTAGSITSQVSANVDAGFSVLTFNGTGANATVGHGLGVAPSMVIMKQRNLAGFQWPVYHSSLGTDKFLFLQRTDGQFTSTAIWQNTAPSSSVIYLGANGNDNNNTGSNMVAYCFADVEGYSKAGSYVGNGSTNGPFVYTGFRPAWVMIKYTSGSQDWTLFDSKREGFNETDKYLHPSASAAEGDYDTLEVDLLSNGFKCRGPYNHINASGGTYIYLAFAENPFKYANAR